MRWFKPVLLSSALLCLWWTNGFSLFSSDFLVNGNVIQRGMGAITTPVIYQEYETNRAQSEWATGFISGLIVRNQFSYFLPILGLEIGLDSVFIPDFTEYSDLGMSRVAWPIGGVVRAEQSLIYTPDWMISLNGYIGIEQVGQLYRQLLYAVQANVTWNIGDKLSIGLKPGYSDQDALYIESGVSVHIIEKLSVAAAFELNGSYKTVKFGTLITVSPMFEIAVGGNFNPEYSGWKLTSGFLLKDVSLFKSKVDLGLSVDYTKIAGIDFMVSFLFK